ncbi:BlaI/MecI/CopY family transcriptional regulator [Clostridium sp. CF012]|uniref:BlaI/MecI/CopY family transcriptional regulator n=1 Tax=Clostridium sp. CF012 TaxID=2843319 RepID=UPI001C0E7675|nr:BlaI/MecI/CopY family transcriptional regulator [Clostridium sp. CF012]MBU3145344.1 BlaI/MecI/CopY family transcriptional regulator [Clostridium sp. CF012]
MERRYYSLVSKEDYLQFETGNFVEQYHENSFISLLSTLHQDKELTDEDLGDLQEWIRKRRSD